ncbi:MAG: DNA polymerase, partial [Dehalococcoidia bacterium]|nr:DNA polymerase [Dehalococcoidia bacterium]
LAQKAEELQMARVVDLENRLVPAICWLERSGVGFDSDRWSALVTTARTKAEKQSQGLSDIATAELGTEGLWGRQGQPINWNSPAQVLRALQGLGLDVDNTRQETLEAVKAQHPIVPPLLAHREAAKKLSTYGDGWSKHIHPATNRVHADWRQIGAATGRMSCKSPNLQNLPREQAYRACFRPETGRVLIKADYSQLELRLAAQIANDSPMKAAFQAGDDLHELTASQLKGKGEPHEIAPEDRQLAKAVNFGLIYGMGAERLADYARSSYGVKMDMTAAKSVRAAYFKAHPGIRSWHASQGRRQETRTVLGRRRTFDGNGYFTEKLNSPVQGTGADGLKFALIELWETRGDRDAYPVLVVHDEIVIEAPVETAQEAKEWLQTCMRNGMAQVLKDVPVVVEARIQDSWDGTVQETNSV